MASKFYLSFSNMNFRCFINVNRGSSSVLFENIVQVIPLLPNRSK